MLHSPLFCLNPMINPTKLGAFGTVGILQKQGRFNGQPGAPAAAALNQDQARRGQSLSAHRAQALWFDPGSRKGTENLGQALRLVDEADASARTAEVGGCRAEIGEGAG